MKKTTLAKNLCLENAKLKVKLLKNQVRANQLTFRFCDIRILIIFESHYELGALYHVSAVATFLFLTEFITTVPCRGLPYCKQAACIVFRLKFPSSTKRWWNFNKHY